MRSKQPKQARVKSKPVKPKVRVAVVQPLTTFASQINWTKFTAKLKTAHSKRPLGTKGPLRMLEVLKPYAADAKHAKRIMLAVAGRGKSTQDAHNRALTRLQNFCVSQGTNLLGVTATLLDDYLCELDDLNVSHGYAAGINGAVKCLVATLKIADPWSEDVSRCYEGLIRRSSCQKGLTKKAAMLPMSQLKAAIERVLWPEAARPDRIRFQDWRALGCQILQYKLLARLSDVLKLKEIVHIFIN